MFQVYRQLDEIGILHRTEEVTLPRWRQDNVYKLVLGTKGAISFDVPRSRVNIPAGQFVLFNPEEKHQQIRCDGDKFLFEFSPKQVLVLAVRGVQSAGSDTARRLDTSGVQKAICMMRECYRDLLSLDDIAAFADMNKFSLIRQFREAVGVTPYEWLLQYRIHRVAEALSGTNETVLMIALDHGFSSVSAMNRQFRRLYGLSPAQWRQLYQDDIHACDENDADS